ncbi:MAG: molecular chaperone DnaJ [Nitrospinae bacterium]|nr:molecular chaperone DnaJ [Nitrospinota bacterium]
MNVADALKILGLDKNPSPSQLKSAYKKLALEFHPDRNPGDPEAEKRFKEIVIAHETLQNPKRSATRATPRGRKSARQRGEYEELWEDIFSHIFKNAREPADEDKVASLDLHAQVEVTLEELTRDSEKDVAVSRRVRCASCGGRGSEAGARRSACPACKGAGEVRYRQGLAELWIPCSACDGSGEHAGETCRDCAGGGVTNRRENLRVAVPAAIKEGAQIRIKGKGDEDARAGEAGDLIVTVRANPHPVFRREGNDVVLDLPVSFSQAALGHEALVPTLKGAQKIKIPAGTQSGREFRLKGEGLSPAGGRNTGDMRVRVIVETPTKLGERQREILDEFQRISSPANHPKARAFQEKMKSLLK